MKCLLVVQVVTVLWGAKGPGTLQVPHSAAPQGEGLGHMLLPLAHPRGHPYPEQHRAPGWRQQLSRALTCPAQSAGDSRWRPLGCGEGGLLPAALCRIWGRPLPHGISLQPPSLPDRYLLSLNPSLHPPPTSLFHVSVFPFLESLRSAMAMARRAMARAQSNPSFMALRGAQLGCPVLLSSLCLDFDPAVGQLSVGPPIAVSHLGRAVVRGWRSAKRPLPSEQDMGQLPLCHLKQHWGWMMEGDGCPEWCLGTPPPVSFSPSAPPHPCPCDPRHQ